MSQVDWMHSLPFANIWANGWTNEAGEWSLKLIFEELCESKPTKLDGLCESIKVQLQYSHALDNQAIAFQGGL